MRRIFIVTPAKAGTRTGNLHTAQRWARLLRARGDRVATGTAWSGERCDVLVALHARRSHDSVVRYRRLHPRGTLVVVLTGTDLYRDLPGSREARESLELADRIVVLQEDARRRLGKRMRRKTSVVYQSADPSVRHAPPPGKFRIAVVGHLRDEKDPFRAVLALRQLEGNFEVVQAGGALAPGYARRARQLMAHEPRYRWLDSVPHSRALRLIAQSHVLVVSSRMEGGANVICEAARIGTPVLASRMSGNIGMLGSAYPGFYRLGDAHGLAALLERSSRDRSFYGRLKSALRSRRPLFAPAAERRALLRAIAAAR